jgi:excisionase family DNA binding protein
MRKWNEQRGRAMSTVVYNEGMTKLEDLMTTAEAAEFLAITAAGVRQLLRRKRLRGAFKKGRDWFIPVSSLKEYRDARQCPEEGESS